MDILKTFKETDAHDDNVSAPAEQRRPFQAGIGAVDSGVTMECEWEWEWAVACPKVEKPLKLAMRCIYCTKILFMTEAILQILSINMYLGDSWV